MLYSYDLKNKKRDLTDVLSTVVADQPRFISLFVPRADAGNTTHEWLEDGISGRAITAANATGLTITLSEADAAKVVKGAQLTIADDSCLFEIASISGTSATLKLIAANGSAKEAPATGDILNIVSTPIVEGSDHGEATYHQGGSEFNYTQIFRKDITLTGTALAVNVYGNMDNALTNQTKFALQELTRDLNRVALFGHRTKASATSNGAAGGLYEFGLQSGGLAVAAGGHALDSYIVNDAAQAILGAGATPSTLIVSPGQARVLSAEYKDKVTIQREDRTRGAHVATIVNAITGGLMTIYADPDVPDTDAWLVDPAGFGLCNLKGRGITDEDATPSGFDGIRRMALGELTFEFKNAKQRLCRISGLKSSKAAIEALRGA